MKSRLLPILITYLMVSSCSADVDQQKIPHKTPAPKLSAEVPTFVPIPNFSKIPKGKKRKIAFFDYLTPLIALENENIRIQRQKLIAIQNNLRLPQSLAPQVQQWLDQIAKGYRVSATNNQQTVEQLLDRIDTIPHSLALAQASIETAWGTSRFAKEGNNYFGQWCFRQGCGLVPLARTDGRTHEVRRFNTPAESIRGYLANLNSHPAYKELRAIRRANRKFNRYTSGCELAPSLRHYSQQGLTYVNSLKSIIRVSKLEPPQHIGRCRKSSPAELATRKTPINVGSNAEEKAIQSYN